MVIPAWHELRVRNACRLAKLMLTISCGSALMNAADLPDGSGKAETVKLCGRCHSLEMTTSLRQGQAGWTETISKMVNLGAQGNEEELQAVLNYLAKFYGPVNGALAAGSAGRAETAAPVTTGSAGALSPRVANTASRLPKQGDAASIADQTAKGVPADAAKEWQTYGHDSGAMRFSPLTQITPQNVGRLKLGVGLSHETSGLHGAARRTGTSGDGGTSTRWRPPGWR